MNQEIENIKEQLEEVIKKNLPEERTQDNLPFENSPEIYGNQRIEAYKNGFNQALSQIPVSLIADEVLKVVVEKIKEEKEIAVKQLAYETDVEIVEYLKGKENLSNDLLNLLTNSSTLEGEQSEHLSPNKENEKNE